MNVNVDEIITARDAVKKCLDPFGVCETRVMPCGDHFNIIGKLNYGSGSYAVAFEVGNLPISDDHLKRLIAWASCMSQLGSA